MTKPQGARRARRTDLLRDCLEWFDKALDQREGDNYRNGDSAAHLGDGMLHAEVLHRRLQNYLRAKGAKP